MSTTTKELLDLLKEESSPARNVTKSKSKNRVVDFFERNILKKGKYANNRTTRFDRIRKALVRDSYSYRQKEWTPLANGIILAIIFISLFALIYTLLPMVSEPAAIVLGKDDSPMFTIVAFGLLLVAGIFLFFVPPFKKDRADDSFKSSIRRKRLGAVERLAKIPEMYVHDERLFRIYNKIYKAFDTVFFIQNDEFGRKEYDAMARQIDKMYDAISFHKRTRMLPTSISIQHDIEMGMFDLVVEDLEETCSEIKDLCSIWSSKTALGGCRVLFARSSIGYEEGEDLEHLGKYMGIDTKIDAYYAGIPAEDLRR